MRTPRGVNHNPAVREARKALPQTLRPDDAERRSMHNNPRSAENHRERLIRFYKFYEPQKLEQIDLILSKFENDEDNMWAFLFAKYGPEPIDDNDDDDEGEEEPASQPHPHRERLIQFYQQYDPPKIEQVDSILSHFENDEDSMWTHLEQTYGPERPHHQRHRHHRRHQTRFDRYDGDDDYYSYRDGRYSRSRSSADDFSSSSYSSTPTDVDRGGRNSNYRHHDADRRPNDGSRQITPSRQGAEEGMRQQHYPPPPSSTRHHRDANNNFNSTSHRERLHRFYTKYDPSKLANLDKILEAAAGKEDDMWNFLIQKYGPEPSSTAPPPPPRQQRYEDTAAGPVGSHDHHHHQQRPLLPRSSTHSDNDRTPQQQKSPAVTSVTPPVASGTPSAVTPPSRTPPPEMQQQQPSSVSSARPPLTPRAAAPTMTAAASSAHVPPAPGATTTTTTDEQQQQQRPARKLPPPSHRERLVRFYEHYDPLKIDQIDLILGKFENDEDNMWKFLCENYGPEPPPPPSRDDEGAAAVAAGSSTPQEQEAAADGDAAATTTPTTRPRGLSFKDRFKNFAAGAKNFTAKLPSFGRFGSKSSNDDDGPQETPEEREERLALEQKTRERVAAFYRFYDPRAVGKVDEVMKKYAGHNEKLIDAFVKKYGPEPGTLEFEEARRVTAALNARRSYKNRLISMYKRYNEKALKDEYHNVDVLLAECSGKEEALIQSMVRKFGPEPAPDEDEQLEPISSEARTGKSYRERVVTIYKLHHPVALKNMKLNVDGLLSRFQGKEEALVQSLVKKYGPEPDLTPDDLAKVRQLSCVAQEAVDYPKNPDGTPWVAPARGRPYRDRIIAFYTFYLGWTPGMMDKVDEVLERYGPNDKLIAEFIKKYGPEPETYFDEEEEEEEEEEGEEEQEDDSRKSGSDRKNNKKKDGADKSTPNKKQQSQQKPRPQDERYDPNWDYQKDKPKEKRTTTAGPKKPRSFWAKQAREQWVRRRAEFIEDADFDHLSAQMWKAMGDINNPNSGSAAAKYKELHRVDEKDRPKLNELVAELECLLDPDEMVTGKVGDVNELQDRLDILWGPDEKASAAKKREQEKQQQEGSSSASATPRSFVVGATSAPLSSSAAATAAASPNATIVVGDGFPHPEARSRLRRFFDRYDPSKSDKDVERMVLLWAPEFDNMFTNLEQRYGPEPGAAPSPQSVQWRVKPMMMPTAAHQNSSSQGGPQSFVDSPHKQQTADTSPSPPSSPTVAFVAPSVWNRTPQRAPAATTTAAAASVAIEEEIKAEREENEELRNRLGHLEEMLKTVRGMSETRGDDDDEDEGEEYDDDDDNDDGGAEMTFNEMLDYLNPDEEQRRRMLSGLDPSSSSSPPRQQQQPSRGGAEPAAPDLSRRDLHQEEKSIDPYTLLDDDDDEPVAPVRPPVQQFSLF